MTALGQSNFLQALGWAVLNSLWQLALLWVIYQLITAAFSLKSSLRSSLATSLLFGGFAWFLFTFSVILADRSNAVTNASFFAIDGNTALNNWLYSSLPIASLVYLVILILPVLNFIRNFRYVQVIRKYALKKADVQLRMFVQKVATQMNIAKPVQVWISDFVSSPVTIGYLKPVILLPMAAISNLSAQQVEAVLLHELSHIKRFDYLLNLISRIIQTILYFNPFVKAFARMIEKEREKSCDEMVMQFQYEPHGYASALLTLEKAAATTRQSLAVAAAGGKKNELLSRVEIILGVHPKKAVSFNKLAGIMAALLCFITLNALLLWSSPAKTEMAKSKMAELNSPYLFFSDENPSGGTEIKLTPIVNHADRQTPSATASLKPASLRISSPLPSGNTGKGVYSEVFQNAFNSSAFSFVSNKENILSEAQEEQVKQAIDASKRVMEDGQWKVVERSIADAMTLAEKTRVKAVYQEAAEKANWQGMEDKLRQAYDQINWPQIKTELSIALAEIKLDSLQKVYTTALVNLGDLKKELNKNNQKGVPDSDITLKSVEEKKSEIEKVVNKIKSVRNRKVVHL